MTDTDPVTDTPSAPDPVGHPAGADGASEPTSDAAPAVAAAATEDPPTVDGDPVHLAGLIRQQAARTGARRLMVGLTGGPGSGKSRLAARLVEELADSGDGAVAVPMDGFHLAQSVLDELDLSDVKGAPETFDGHGYLALLHRLRAAVDPIVYAPRFVREIEEPIAGAIPVPAATRFVITEGNYLLLAGEPWSLLRGVLDAVWYLDPSEDVRVNRLVRRHIAFGRPPVEALRRATSGSDADNAVLIAQTRRRADLIVTT